MKNKKQPYWGMIAFAVIVIYLWLTSCNPYGFAIWPEDDPHWTPQPVIFQCNSYAPATSPHYVQGWCEMDAPPNGWVLHVGPYTDTVFTGQEDQLDFKLSLLINALLPQYETEVYSREDAERIAIFTKGTDDKAVLNFKVWIDIGGAKYYPAFSKRAFYLGGAVTLIEWQQLSEEYPTGTGFNLRDLVADSLGENTAMLAQLDSCKLCEGCRADFRFNEFAPSDSIVQAFKDAHWNTIPFTSGGSDSRSSVYDNGVKIGVIKGEILDARGCHITNKQIIAFLDSGIQVITN